MSSSSTFLGADSQNTANIKAYLNRDEDEDKRRFFASQQQQPQKEPPPAAQPQNSGTITESVPSADGFSVASLLDSLRRSDDERKARMEERKRELAESLERKKAETAAKKAEALKQDPLPAPAPSPDPTAVMESLSLPQTQNGAAPAPATQQIYLKRDHELLQSKTAEIERLTEEVNSLSSQLTTLKKLAEEDKMIDAYHKDNERLTNENKRLLARVRSLEKEVETLIAKSMNEAGAEAPTFRDLERLKAELHSREEEHKVESEALRKEKKELERRLGAVDWGKVEDDAIEMRTLKAQMTRLKQQHETDVSELKQKITWYAENMDLAQSSASLLREQQSTIITLRARVVELEGGPDKLSKTKAHLERDRQQRDMAKRVSELEEALRTRNPNSLTELIRACKPTEKEIEETKVHQDRIKTLEARIISQGEEADAVIKSLRIECDKMRVNYESRLRQKDDDMKVRMQALHTKREKELEKTSTEMRQYYVKKVKELEQQLTLVRRGQGMGPAPKTKLTPPAPSPTTIAKRSDPEAQLPQPQQPPSVKVQGAPQPTPPAAPVIIDNSAPLRAEIEQLRALLAAAKSEREQAVVFANDQARKVQDWEVAARHHQSVVEEACERLRQQHREVEWSLRQDHQRQVAEMRARWEQDVGELKGQLQNATALPQLASLDARGRVEYLQMVSQRLTAAEQHFAFRVSELQREAAEAKNIAAMEISVERQKMSLLLEQKNTEIERFQIQLDTMLHDIGMLGTKTSPRGQRVDSPIKRKYRAIHAVA